MTQAGKIVRRPGKLCAKLHSYVNVIATSSNRIGANVKIAQNSWKGRLLKCAFVAYVNAVSIAFFVTWNMVHDIMCAVVHVT